MPIIVNSGMGTASDEGLEMELGANLVLMNTVSAGAQDPVSVADAVRLTIRRIPRKMCATHE